ncbi:conserved membrane hypothetical protein [Bradyrhizobium oligotrophicum S58]|uniref:Uncharacterized protein n=1 Tax=Bradyrhizobium oligotrophicum S58 TaxID=1245469 RepID=M4Z5F3_9BRAD|nr:conserved membrane hypothetical protein [Bradyrhizobium oligotrophicum S58]
MTAQSTYHGLLSPLREWLTNLWLVDGGPLRDIMSLFGGGTPEKLGFGMLWFLAVLAAVSKFQVGPKVLRSAAGRQDIRHYAGGMNGWQTRGGSVA